MLIIDRCIVTTLYWLKAVYFNWIFLLAGAGKWRSAQAFIINRPFNTPWLDTTYWHSPRHTHAHTAEQAPVWATSSATTQVAFRNFCQEPWMCLRLSKLQLLCVSRQRRMCTSCSSLQLWVPAGCSCYAEHWWVCDTVKLSASNYLPWRHTPYSGCLVQASAAFVKC